MLYEVITISLTLYNAPLYIGSLRAMNEAVNGLDKIRITSYNVCYTKLLRTDYCLLIRHRNGRCHAAAIR